MTDEELIYYASLGLFDNKEEQEEHEENDDILRDESIVSGLHHLYNLFNNFEEKL